ncbi:SGNH/GDSL hydrolase family protein [Kitasatospora camelliae]|uniref:GDSL-type esterase/lipase family protein n=1 Tax=Kitasatospora camelliae TaxID=3156397 RepID=A0AAU8K2L4_9ACTN
MTDTPYSPDTAAAIAEGATSAGWVRNTGVPWDGDLDSYNLRALDGRTAAQIAALRDGIGAILSYVAPPTSTLRIMCVGDSITVGAGSIAPGGLLDPWGNGSGPGYRPWLSYLLAQRRIAAQLAVVAEGGQMLRQMAPRALAALPTVRPDVVLIHLGTNDIGMDAGPDWPTRYGQLVDSILASSPTVRVACARIAHYRRPDLDAGVDQINSWVDSVVQARKSGGRVCSADMTVVSPSWTADGTHPLDAAYLAMAQQWMNAIAAWLPAS